MIRLPLHRLAETALIAVVVVTFLALAPPATAQLESPAFPSMQLDATARQAALGGLSPAVSARGAASLFVNPALLDAEAHGSLELSYLNHVSDITAGWASYARHMDGIGTMAIGLRALSFGEFERADAAGQTDGTFSAGDVALSAGLSRNVRPGLRAGASLNLMRSSIDSESASALAMDLGVVYHAPQGSMTYAAGMYNLGVVTSSLGRQDDSLPFDLRVGVTRRIQHLPLLVSVTAYRLDKLDGGPDGSSAVENLLYHVNLAGEFQFSQTFQVRFGYSQRRHDELKVRSRLDLAGLSTGLGIQISRVGIDYAFNSWSSLGGLHRFSVRTTL